MNWYQVSSLIQENQCFIIFSNLFLLEALKGSAFLKNENHFFSLKLGLEFLYCRNKNSVLIEYLNWLVLIYRNAINFCIFHLKNLLNFQINSMVTILFLNTVLFSKSIFCLFFIFYCNDQRTYLQSMGILCTLYLAVSKHSHLLKEKTKIPLLPSALQLLWPSSFYITFF